MCSPIWRMVLLNFDGLVCQWKFCVWESLIKRFCGKLGCVWVWKDKKLCSFSDLLFFLLIMWACFNKPFWCGLMPCGFKKGEILNIQISLVFTNERYLQFFLLKIKHFTRMHIAKCKQSLHFSARNASCKLSIWLGKIALDRRFKLL